MTIKNAFDNGLALKVMVAFVGVVMSMVLAEVWSMSRDFAAFSANMASVVKIADDHEARLRLAEQRCNVIGPTGEPLFGPRR